MNPQKAEGPSVDKFIGQAQRRGLVPVSKGYDYSGGGTGTRIERDTKPEEIMQRLSRALEIRLAWLKEGHGDTEADTDLAKIQAEIDASRVYLRAALGEQVDGLDGARETLKAFDPRELELVVYDCASLEEAWQKAAELSGETASTFPEEFGRFSCRHLLKEEALAPQSVRVEFNPATQALTFYINFGKDEPRIKGGVTRNGVWDGKYLMTDSLNLVIPADDPKKVVDDNIDFDREYTWEEAVALLVKVFKVDQEHIEAVFGSYMDSVAKMCKNYGDRIKFRKPRSEDDYHQIGIMNGTPGGNFDSFAYLGAENGEVNFGTLS